MKKLQQKNILKYLTMFFHRFCIKLFLRFQWRFCSRKSIEHHDIRIYFSSMHTDEFSFLNDRSENFQQVVEDRHVVELTDYQQE